MESEHSTSWRREAGSGPMAISAIATGIAFKHILQRNALPHLEHLADSQSADFWCGFYYMPQQQQQQQQPNHNGVVHLFRNASRNTSPTDPWCVPQRHVDAVALAAKSAFHSIQNGGTGRVGLTCLQLSDYEAHANTIKDDAERAAYTAALRLLKTKFESFCAEPGAVERFMALAPHRFRWRELHAFLNADWHPLEITRYPREAILNFPGSYKQWELFKAQGGDPNFFRSGTMRREAFERLLVTKSGDQSTKWKHLDGSRLIGTADVYCTALFGGQSAEAAFRTATVAARDRQWGTTAPAGHATRQPFTKTFRTDVQDFVSDLRSDRAFQTAGASGKVETLAAAARHVAAQSLYQGRLDVIEAEMETLISTALSEKAAFTNATASTNQAQLQRYITAVQKLLAAEAFFYHTVAASALGASVNSQAVADYVAVPPKERIAEWARFVAMPDDPQNHPFFKQANALLYAHRAKEDRAAGREPVVLDCPPALWPE